MRSAFVVAGAFGMLAILMLPAHAEVTASGAYVAALAQHAVSADAAVADPNWQAGQITTERPFEDITTRASAPLSTTAYVLYDAHNLYVAFKARQPAVPITANQPTNDVGFGLDDFVGVGIDTSGNGSTVYFFETTPRGTRYQQASENARYNPIWTSVARIEGNTWTAVMTIPLNVLHYTGSSTRSWRINFVRGIASNGDHYTWAFDGRMQDAPIPQWPAFADAQYWPHISGIAIAAGSSGRLADRARADIYALGSAGDDRKLFQQANSTFAPESARPLGVDLTYALTDTIHFVATLNPDFSNVEVDQQTITPQEFRRQYLEYRPFFAQGASFLTPLTPPYSGGVFQPNNQIFYSPSVGPFDRGEKVEGTFGDQSFGVLSFRGYDQTTGNEFDDIAYGYTHTLPDQSFEYWSDGVIAHHSLAGDDTAAEVGTQLHDVRSGWIGGIDEAFEGGSYVSDPGYARSLSAWQQLIKPNYQVLYDYQDVTPNYNPIDGFTSISDTRGSVIYINASGSSKDLKGFGAFFGGDRYLDESGAIHQEDIGGQIKATLRDLITVSIGPQDGQLRTYALQAPGPLGCTDPNLPRTSYTGFPHYYCGQTDLFNQLVMKMGYRDGTPSPTDFQYVEGPFGGTFLQQYSISGSRSLGARYSVSAQLADTDGREIANGLLSSQQLRLVSLGANLGPDSNVALALQSISGNVAGLTTVPGLNLALSFHKKFLDGNELYLAYGTPAATQTLNRFIAKYIFHAGLQN